MSVPAHYLDRIRDVRPDLAIESARLNQEGLVNDVVIVNDELVCRFPTSDRARAALAREVRILRIVADHVALPVPRVLHVSGDMACHPMLPGDPLRRDMLESLPSAARGAVIEQIGTFLRDLHGIETGDLTGAAPSDATRTREDWLAFFARVEREVFPHLMAYQREAVAAHFAPVVSGELDLAHPTVLIHGDLAPYHLLFDPAARRLTGVIDFGTGGLGDPAIDVSCLIYQYGESMVREVARHHPEVEGCIDRARFWAGTLELQWALAGLASDDRPLLVAHIGSARDVRPYGTPLT